jgi:hypothetical protein
MKIFVKFFSSFCSSENCISVYERLCPQFVGGNIVITNDDSLYTHAIIINVAMPNLRIKKENVIGLAFEPPAFLNLTNEFIEYAKKNIETYYIGDNLNNGLPSLFKSYYGFLWHITPSITNFNFEKTKLMSIIISDKQLTTCQSYRHSIVKAILSTNLPIDIYGKGCYLYKKHRDSRVKGSFIELEPYKDYKYHICIENFETNDYFSEKITNPLLVGTIPIYLGCKQIKKYFSQEENLFLLTGNINNDMNLIFSICNEKIKGNKMNFDSVLNTISLYNELSKVWKI